MALPNAKHKIIEHYDVVSPYYLLKLCQQAFHFRAGMLIALPISCGNAPVQQRLGFFRAIVLRQRLRVHLVARHIIGICFEQVFEMRFGGGDITLAQAFKSDAVS